MCGFLFTNFPDVSPRSFEVALKAFKFRGPDSTNIKKIKNEVFGHNRLSILGTDKRNDQPLTDSFSGNTFLYNGEFE